MNIEEKIKEQLSNTVGDMRYNGWNNRTSYGYHSYNIGDVNIVGQRNPKMRLDEFRKHIDFNNKVVVDFGCNVGSMLHHLTEIKSGFGFDYDTRCIDAGVNIAELLGRDNLNYHVHDFDKDQYETVKEKITDKPDVLFLLSLGSWVKSWKDLYSLALEYDGQIVLEINNEDEGKVQIEFFKEKGFDVKLIIDNSLDDSTGNNRRKTYIIK